MIMAYYCNVSVENDKNDDNDDTNNSKNSDDNDNRHNNNGGNHPIRKRAHTQLVRERSATVVSARRATVDRSWRREWN